MSFKRPVTSDNIEGQLVRFQLEVNQLLGFCKLLTSNLYSHSCHTPLLRIPHNRRVIKEAVDRIVKPNRGRPDMPDCTSLLS